MVVTSAFLQMGIMWAVFCNWAHSFVAVHTAEILAISVDKVVDTTGAGDAFLGGIIAGDVMS